MIEGILAISVAVWFYQAARRSGRDPFFWAAVGAGVFYATVFLWVGVNKLGFMEQLHHQSVAVGAFVHYLGSALGLLAAWAVQKLGLK
ncbi:hypothetical protein JCM13664_10160 [Methylothermus subterraneus]